MMIPSVETRRHCELWSLSLRGGVQWRVVRVMSVLRLSRWTEVSVRNVHTSSPTRVDSRGVSFLVFGTGTPVGIGSTGPSPHVGTRLGTTKYGSK